MRGRAKPIKRQAALKGTFNAACLLLLIALLI
jgi:hypothetical protein